VSTAPPPTASSTLSLHDALPIYERDHADAALEDGHQSADLHGGAGAPDDAARASRPVADPFRPLGADPAQRVAGSRPGPADPARSEEHTSEIQSQSNLVCRLLLE